MERGRLDNLCEHQARGWGVGHIFKTNSNLVKQLSLKFVIKNFKIKVFLGEHALRPLVNLCFGQ